MTSLSKEQLNYLLYRSLNRKFKFHLKNETITVRFFEVEILFHAGIQTNNQGIVLCRPITIITLLNYRTIPLCLNACLFT